LGETKDPHAVKPSSARSKTATLTSGPSRIQLLSTSDRRPSKLSSAP
jgi:hypothetical protein